MAISELGMQQILLQGFQRAQDSAQTNQIQLATGDKHQTYSGYGADALRLLSSEGVFTRATAYENAGQIALSRHELIGEGLSQIVSSVEAIRAGFTRTLATGSAELLAPEIRNEAQRIISALNIEIGGVFLFGGVNGAAPAVNAQSLADIGAAADLDDLFVEGPRATLAVEEGVNIGGGPLASEAARDLFAELQELANAETSLGAFSGELTDAQRAFVIDKSQQLANVVDGLFNLLGLNAVSQGAAADAVTRNQQRRDLAEIVASEIENTDIAAAISRLNQDQLAIQASAQALSQATQLSLLNFI